MTHQNSEGNTTHLFNAIYKFNIGEWDMMVIKDLRFTLDAAIFGANLSAEAIQNHFTDLGVLNGDNSVNMLNDILVARRAGMTILFDTGMGAAQGGVLLESLASVGIQAADVTHVIMSHWHPDHIDGLSQNDVLTFPQALVLFPQADYDFMQSLPDLTAGSMAKLQPAIDADQVQFYGEGELLNGITALHTPGHTPGHMSFAITSNGSKLINMVDSVMNMYTHPEHPDWHVEFDADAALATKTRVKLMTMIAEEKALAFGYHFPFPGLGHMVKDADAFRFYPVAF